MAEKKINDKLSITLKTFFGMEEVLVEELTELGYSNAEVLNRAVKITGSWKDVYFLNVNVRCAITILVEIARFKIKHEDELYKKAKRIDWTGFFDINKSFAVKGAVFSKFFKHSQYPFLVVKDAIADVFRDQHGDRPNVNIKHPQVLIDLYIKEDECVLSLNTSGAPLFQRGYRDSTGDAPLNEVVAAGLIRLSKWDKKSPFIDPFCGSGTLLIEAAMLATGIPPTIERQHFAFKNFKNFDREYWDELQEGIDRRVRDLPCKILGGDVSAEMVLKTKRNLRTFAFGRHVEVHNCSFQELPIEKNEGTMVTNPPYGERIGENIEELYGEIGSWMKHHLSGIDCWVISSNKGAMNEIGLKPNEKIRLYNGSLECSFRNYSVYEGSRKNSAESKEID